jgi:hypothetical protein
MDVPPEVVSPSHDQPDSGVFLIVQNGRQRGTRQPLRSPVTILGRASGCDVRLNADGVADLHCALALGPSGLVVRDLGQAGTLVNGQPVTMRSLTAADQLTIGPFQFLVELPTPLPPDEERAALRIQAAAVAAQQAALAEEEQRLQQRQAALENQEHQLAAHLEQRRQRLVEAHQQFRAEKSSWREQCATMAQEHAATAARLEDLRSEADRKLTLARDRRHRVVQLRRRLVQRFRRDWSAKEADLSRREQELEGGKTRLAREVAGLQKQRSALHEARLRHNGEVELGRRQLQDQWEELGLAQERWEHCLEQEEQAQNRRREEAETRLAAAEATLHACASQIEAAERNRNILLEECAGLEVRIRHGRQQLQELDRAQASRAHTGRAQGLATPLTLSPLTEPPPLAIERVQYREATLTTLIRVSGQLADQRAHLIEQWHHLLACHDAFQQEHKDALSDAEAIAQRLVLREQDLFPREQALESERLRLAEWQDSLERQRNSLEAWQSRLAIQRSETEADAALLAQGIQDLRQATDTLLLRQKRLPRRLLRVWRKEVDVLRTARLRSDEARRQYLTLLEELHIQLAQLSERERRHAAEAVALEQMYLELLGRSATPAAEKRVAQMRRQAKAAQDNASADLHRLSRALQMESQALDNRAQALQRAEERLLARQQKRARQQTIWETRRDQVSAAEERAHGERQRLEAQHQADERRLASLREEVERLASVLLNEAGPERSTQALPTTQAA